MHRKSKSTLVGILIAGVFFSLLLSGLMLRYELTKVQGAFANSVNQSTERVKKNLQDFVSADDQFRFLFQVNEDVSEDDFLVFSQTMVSQLPYTEEIIYAPKIRSSHITLEEKKFQRKGYTGFRFRPFLAQQAIETQFPDIIFPVKLIQPYTPYTSVWLGRDLLTFRVAQAVLFDVVSFGKKMQIVFSDDGRNKRFYAFSAVSFVSENQQNGQVLASNIFGVIGYELDLIGLLAESYNSNISRNITLNGRTIINEVAGTGESFFLMAQVDTIDFEGQTFNLRYQLPNALSNIDFRIPALILLMFLLVTLLVYFVVNNYIERQKILDNQNRVIEDQVKQKTRLLKEQATQIQKAFYHQLSVSKELESFSYSISHDLRAPLRSISGFANMLNEDYRDQLDDEGRDMLSRIEKGAEKMSILIDDLLTLSKISRRDFNTVHFSMSKLVNNQVAELCNTHSLKCNIIDVEDDLYADADRNLVRIAINNLLTNAIKYSAKAESPVVAFGATEKDGKRVFFVKDNGVGFDMRYANKLFIAFQRLHGSEFEGTGIGLAIVQRIMLRHGGKIWAESEAGKGATFYFTLS